MKFSLLTLAALVALATADISVFRKQADSVFLDKQRKVLKLFVGLGADTKTYHHHEPVPFPYTSPELYKKEGVAENFQEIYKRGMLDRRGVFTLNSKRNLHDTNKLFDIFYFAKDFDTFFSVASWARDELNPVQWGYCFTMAVFHREDTRGIYIPPVYEIFPHFFTQNEVIHQAISDKAKGVTTGHYEVNNTGWEYSWHADMLTGPYKSSPKWVGDDTEIRLSYFREDVGLSNFLSYFSLRFQTWLAHTPKYPDIHYYRTGEVYYSVFKWLKNRYNLERMSNGMTPVVPFEIFEKLPGYNSHIQDNFGRSYLVREDHLIAEEVNKDGAWELDQVISRIADIIDSGVIRESELKVKSIYEEGFNAFDEFSKILFGIQHTKNQKYYKRPFQKYLRTVNDMVKAPNDRDFTNTAMGSVMTQARDPVFYMILANLDKWFDKFLDNFPAYTKEQLNFPGVSIDKFELDRLDTYFERYDWELTNGINFANRAERIPHKYEASQFRLNHKPFSYKMHVKSDKEDDVMVRVFLGPKTDVDGRFYSLDQQRRSMIVLDIFKTKVKPGDNVIERHSHQFPYFGDYQKFRPFYEKVNKSIDSKEAFYYNEVWQCEAPSNLMIPRGAKYGKEFVVFATVTKFDHEGPQDGYYQCHHNYFFDQHSVYYPFDRPIHFNDFIQPNMILSPVKIYHTY